ncbi:Aromatic amino acid lyase [Dethiosulfatibacter aminovorans DSM 17477]|uniref:Aromatic amino acid lyase n=1 Tax=Dethiosulfatibacter aminovorans DSM 17477 TaxID=1121476 RepID=A0A1M6A9I4_9FIRM|nr:aromatic amino acid lyase [Dethiosulfatibacter aminovorans]SHI33120.1 Aromatic amino acid lyase [Dethiosulfatibacter aminovorans DSM 17477]
MKTKTINFDFLAGKIKSDNKLIDSHYPESITALTLYLLAREYSDKVNFASALEKKAEASLPSIPASLATEKEQADFIIEVLGDLAGMADNMREVLHKVLPAAYGIYGVVKSMNLAKAVDLTLALNLEAIRGERGAFDLRLHNISRPFKQQENSAENTLRILEDTEFADDKGRFSFGYDTHPRCQDAISFRAAPQTHGGARDALDFMKKSIEEYMESDLDLSTQLRYAADMAITALAGFGNISERRAFRLNDHNFSYGLPTNLIYKDPGYNHGFVVVQAVGTAILGELKTNALPTRSSMDERLNRTLAFSSAKRVVDSLGLLSKILMIEAFMSCQGIDLVRKVLPELKLGKGTEAAYSRIRESVKLVESNRYIIPEMNELDRMIFTGELISAVEDAVGSLK